MDSRICLVAVMVTALCVGPFAATAAAAPNGTNTTTTTATPTPTTTAGSVGNGTAATVIQVGEFVAVTDYAYSEGEFRVTFRATLPTLVVMSDVLGPVQDAGAATVPQREILLEQGTTTVTMSVGTYRGAAAISVSTSGGAVYLSTGISPPNPFAGSSATLGWFSGAGIGLAMVGIAAIRVKRSRDDSPTVAGED